jgi:hypothetical protein
MSDTKPSAAAAEKLAKELKATLAKRRPKPWKTVLATLAVCTLLLAALAWWFYPRPKLDPLQVVALDAVVAPGERLTVHAQLYPPTEEKPPRQMSGYTVVFSEPPPLLQPVGKTHEVVKESDDDGQAATEWLAPKTDIAEFRTHHIDLVNSTKAIDHARIFVVPKDAPILLVDIDETLLAKEVDPEAIKTLKRAVDEGWRIAYLAVTSVNPQDYRKVRDWTISQSALPRGPVLGRLPLAYTQTSERARRELLKSLRDQFTGNLVTIVKSVDAAAVSKEAGMPTYQMSAEPIAGVVGIESWKDVPLRLKK